jgi:hypothetical protein
MSEPYKGPPSPPERQPSDASQHDLNVGDRPRRNGIGVVAFISGLLGLVLIWTVLAALVLSPLAVVLGAVGLAKGRRSGAGIGLAVAGLTLGLVSVALLGLLWWGFAHGSGG